MLAAIVLSLETVVEVVIFLIVVSLVFGLLFWLTRYIEGEWPTTAPSMKIIRVILVILAVLVLIGMLLSFAGHPILVLR